jgi:hypothetical protein
VVVLSASLTATALAPAGDVAATALPAALARTGAEGVVPMVAFGIASIGLGLVMLVLARRAVANSTQ